LAHSQPKPIVSVQVRQLVEFALRTGDLGGERDFVGPRRALAGTRGHQRLQRSRPAGYQKEVRLSHEIETPEFLLRIQGRIDGVLTTPQEVLIEEIKTVQSGWDRIADPLHWAQAKIYGFIYARDNSLDPISIQLTYLDLDTGELTEFRDRCSLSDLSAFFENATAIYLDWMREQFLWRRQRNDSIYAVPFPFPQYRPGQRELAVAAYRALTRGGRLFLEAPTGIGKTISVLFPAVKALGEGKFERIFYLTARTVGRMVAQKAFADLRAAGLRCRTLTLTAKDKICFQAGQPCDAQACPFAQGYYDRLKPALRDALGREEITRPVLESVSQAHQLCPFELSLDLSLWADAVICDYNYVFDPKLYLRRHFTEPDGDYAFLVDEAHNLVDRSREMFSAELSALEVNEVRRAIKDSLPRCARTLSKLASAIRKLPGQDGAPTENHSQDSPEPDLFLAGDGSAPAPFPLAVAPGHVAVPDRCAGVQARRELPPELAPLLEDALREAEAWLARNQPAEFRPGLLELYFRLQSFARTADLYDEHYVTLLEPGRFARVRLFCLDPSFLLRQALQRGRAALFFSATLTPLEYYRDLLGGSPEDPVLKLRSPFPPEHLAVLIQDRIRTHLKARAESLLEVVVAIGELIQQRRGNYLVYFPSYAYLNAACELFQARFPDIAVLVQRPAMTESDRDAFLNAFTAEHAETLAGFAVMGGVFGEGIDLVGDRLIGAVVVGVGLPQLSAERDFIRDYFQEKIGAGFDYAYTFPGMNRVLQATGRVIRSETDRGIVLLIDARFAEERYRRLFPTFWKVTRVRTISGIRDHAARFWGAPGFAPSKLVIGSQ
jgi:DNA excision repair protein ERCC-2